jgi:hypothetical protein
MIVFAKASGAGSIRDTYLFAYGLKGKKYIVFRTTAI